MENMINNQRGFMLPGVVFLTLIVSFGALILLNAKVRVQQRNSTLYLTAINLANEQFAEIESRASADKYLETDFMGNPDDLKSFNGVSTAKIEDGTAVPIEFDVETSYENAGKNLIKAKVTVKWSVGGKEKSIESQKIIRAR